MTAMTGNTETTWLDATAHADLVRRGEVSPKELAEAAIGRARRPDCARPADRQQRRTLAALMVAAKVAAADSAARRPRSG
jgi:Asp-tRNA(Asn)/Glu-tRNA(Gln) amidotransferase A subunit family amidase